MPHNNSCQEDRNDGREEASASEVPGYLTLNGIDEGEFDFVADDSDDDDDNEYELLSQESEEQAGGQLTYYPHHVVVHWNDAEEEISPDGGDKDAAESADTGDQSKPTVDSEGNTQKSSILMNEERINQIKNVMSNFKLPDDHIPAWASSVSEEEWQSVLASKIQANKK